MFGKVARSISALFGREKVERWSPEKLAEVKAYLETKPSQTFTREDHYLCVDFLFHRYYPKDEPVLKSTWNKRRGELREKIDWNIDHLEEAANKFREVPEDPDFAEWLKKTLSDTKK